MKTKSNILYNEFLADYEEEDYEEDYEEYYQYYDDTDLDFYGIVQAEDGEFVVDKSPQSILEGNGYFSKSK